jgi:hypothetical protein
MDRQQLRQIIRQELKSLAEGKMLKTREGDRVERGSDQHVEELERDLEELMSMRSRRNLRERERYVLSRAVEHVRATLKRAKSAQAKRNSLIVDSES